MIFSSSIVSSELTRVGCLSPSYVYILIMFIYIMFQEACLVNKTKDYLAQPKNRPGQEHDNQPPAPRGHTLSASIK